MEQNLTVELTPEFTKRAYDAFVMRGKGVRPFGIKDLAFIIFMGTAFGVMLYYRVDAWLSYAVAGALGLYVLVGMMFIPPYYLGLREALAPYKKFPSHKVDYRIDDQGISSRSEIGNGELKWSGFDKLYRFPEFWLIGVLGGDTVVLPKHMLSEELQGFIESRLRQAGAKII